MTTSSSGSEQIDFMHWLIRLVAFIIDSIIIAIPTYIIWFIITITVIFSGGFFFAYGFLFIFPLILGIIEVLYFVILDVYWGATIGKRILGLQVQMKNGGKVPFDKAFIRNISKIFWLFLIIDWLVGILTPGDKRQKYTDRIAGTTVVQARQAFQSTAPPPSSSPPSPPSS
jgi:uncharacterized RDD family membrane protein YckC